jgi:hypothetical protein
MAHDQSQVIIAVSAIRIELTWDTDGTDVDSHFLEPGAEWESEGDCYYANPNPDWGVPGDTADNPSLDQDDTDGYGPENITLAEPYIEPPEGGMSEFQLAQTIYRYKVHYYDDWGHGPTTATVKIWINGVKVAEFSKLLENDDVWDCAIIYWPSGVVSGMDPAIAMTKTADPLIVYAGDNVTYTFTVTNAGTAILNNVSVYDNDTEAEATYQSGDTDLDGTLDLDETWIFTLVYTTSGEDIGTLENTATAQGTFWYTDETVDDEDSFSVTVVAPLEITTVELPGGNIDIPYEETLTASGGYGTLHWEIIDGALPDGLELAEDGTISGTPTTEGEFTFTVQVTDDATGVATLELTIVIFIEPM